MVRSISIFCMILTLFVVATPSFADWDRFLSAHQAADHRGFRAELPLQQLLSAFITRPGITADSDRRALLPAIHAGVNVFSGALRQDKRLQRFSHDLKPLLAAYNAETARAAEGLAGAEARGVAMDRLLAGIFGVARQAKIYPEEVDMALFQAAAAIEESLSRSPAAKAMSLEGRELIFFLLMNSIYQVHKRAALLAEPLNAMEMLSADPSQVATYAQRFAWCGPALARELVGLERTVSTPNILGDLNNLIMIQFNTEAANDIFSLKVGLGLSSLASSLDLTPLAARMASMGGIMSSMTVNMLQESGAVPFNFLILAAYNWVTPSTPLTYTPDANLPNKLSLLGVPSPTPPDFSMFTTPYRDIFQLRYDLSLCDQIMGKEWQDAEDQAYAINRRPLTMAERTGLHKADAARRQAVMARLNGATPQVRHALRILLSNLFGK